MRLHVIPEVNLNSNLNFLKYEYVYFLYVW